MPILGCTAACWLVIAGLISVFNYSIPLGIVVFIALISGAFSLLEKP
jgi:hypothetical protein